MQRLVVFNPAIKDHAGTPNDNTGDAIIWQEVQKHLRKAFGPAVQIASIPSHVPPDEAAVKQIRKADYRFVGGSNLLGSNMKYERQWKVSGRVMAFRHRAILIGVGWGSYQPEPDAFTRFLLQSVLSQKQLHSVRDGYSERQLRAAGFTNVINTSCPTLWDWAGEPRIINTQKPSDRVLLMLTDYRQHEQLDRKLVEVLADRYQEIIFWPQGSGDLYYGSYLLFHCRRKVRFLEGNLPALENFLREEGPLDYVGTRLHGGIKCLKAGCRGVILEIDNRATEIAKETGLPTAKRNDLETIAAWVRQRKPGQVHIKPEPIQQWMDQFKSTAN